MAELSKQALKVQNNTEFPNNNAGLITPSKLRGFNVDMIDSLVDEISYVQDSASWNQQIDSLENFTASLATNFVTTGSFNSFTQSFNSFSASVTQSIVDLQNFSASLSGGFVTEGELQAATASLINQINTKTDTSSFNAYTSQANNRLTNLEAATASINSSITQLNASSASQQISINALNVFTASQSTASIVTSINNLNSFTQSAGVSLTNLNSATASLFTSASLGLTTASFDNGNRNLTFSKGDGTTFAVNIPDVSGSAGNFVTTSSFNAYTQSNDQRVSSLEANSGSVNTSITNINSATQSLFTSASLGLTTASVNLNTITFSKGDGSTFNLTVDTGSGGGGSVPAGTISGSAQITALGFVSSSVTASSLVTASISGQLLTFTKGNGTQFNLTLPTGSGGSGQAVTASYGAFSDTTTQSGSANVAYPFKFDTVDIVDGVTLSGSTGLQVNSTGVYNIQFSAQGDQGAGAGVGNIWFRQNGSDIPNSDTQFTIPSNQKFVAAWNIFATASAGDHFEIIWRSDSANTTWAFITGSGTSPNSPSVIATVNRIDVGGTTSIDTGSLVTTASFNAYTQSNDQKVNSLIAATGSYATLGANTFTGTQTLSNGAGDKSFRLDAGGLFVTYGQTAVGNFEIAQSGSVALRGNGPGQFEVLATASFVAGPSIPNITSDLKVNGNFTASLQNGYVWVGNSSGVSTAVATASFSSLTGSSLVTASVSLNTITFTKGDASTFNITIDTGSGGGGGGQTFANPSVESISGSLVLSALTFTSGAANLLHLSASAQNQANLVFKNNNNIGTTQVSGSNNIFTNPTIPAAGRVNYIGGSSNLFLNGQSQQLPTITGSAASVSGNRPTMNANYIAGTHAWSINQANNPGNHTYNNNLSLGTGTWTWNMTGNTGAVVISNNIGANTSHTINLPSRSFAEIAAGASGSVTFNMLNNIHLGSTIAYNAPVSSSGTHTFAQNWIAGANQTFNLQSGSRGYNISSNSLIGANTINDNTITSPSAAGGSIQNNILSATTINNRGAAGPTIVGNSIQNFTISNDYDSTSNGTTGRTFVFQGNNIFGQIANNIYFSGSAAGTGTTNDRGRGLYGNLIGGNRISASVIGDGNRHLIASAIVGHGLNIYGTSPYDASNAVNAGGANGGSAFFGRWNAEDGNKANSSETVFAVGTGNSGSAGITRKTGFLIDSGSNTFVEGTLNVSGASSLNGNLIITGSLTASLQQGYVWVGNANGITTTVATSSFGGGGAAFPYTGNAVITGSLGISGSMFGGVISLSVVSSTASVDFSAGNMFTLTLPSASTHINPTNIRAGQTVNIQITQPTPGTGSVTFPSNVKFAGGNDYQATTTGSAIDMLTLVSYDGTNVLGTSIKNFL